jgi:hypothetical protein
MPWVSDMPSRRRYNTAASIRIKRVEWVGSVGKRWIVGIIRVETAEREDKRNDDIKPGMPSPPPPKHRGGQIFPVVLMATRLVRKIA